ATRKTFGKRCDAVACDRLAERGGGLDRRELDPPSHSELLAPTLLDDARGLGMLLEELLHVLAALAEALATVGEPRAALLNHLVLDREIEQVAFARDAFAVHHVELGLAERRRQLVLHDLHAGPSANDR